MKAYMIECRTGCTCCSSENHYRGFYKTKEDAERRINYYFSPESKFWPLASQYARRGRYSIEEAELEEISNDRWILNDEKVLHSLNFIDVKEDGSIENNEEEHLFSDWY